MSAPPGLLERALVEACNRALALDPVAGERLAGLVGRRVAVQLDAPRLRLDLIVAADGRLELDCSGQPADLELSTTPGHLLGLLAGVPGVGRVGRLWISGDVELARTLEQLARNFEPAWTEALSRVVGDTFAAPLARAVGGTLSAIGHGLRHGLASTVEFLREERRDLVAGSEAEALYQEIEALRDRVERLEVRLKRLAAQRSKPR